MVQHFFIAGKDDYSRKKQKPAARPLYEYEFRKDAGDKNLDYKDILERNLAEYKSSIDDVVFVDDLVSGVLSSTAKLDEELRPLALKPISIF